MADKTTGGLDAVEEAAIGSLPGIADLYDDTLIPVEQQGEARHMTGAQWKRYAQAGVQSYVEAAQEAAKDALDAVAGIGQSEENAAASAEAAKEAREAIENLEVSADTLPVWSPASVTKTQESGHVKLEFGLPAGATGAKGDPGTSIQSIERTAGTGAAGTTDTYTVTMSDGTEFEYQVYNGADGQGSGDMMKAIYDTENRNTDVFQYVDEKLKNIPATAEKVSYSNTESGLAAVNVQAALDELAGTLGNVGSILDQINGEAV